MSRSSFSRKVLSTFDSALAFWFSTTCFFCHESSGPHFLCEECRAVDFLKPPICFRCGTPLSFATKSCGICEKRGFQFSSRSMLWLTDPHHEVWKQVKFRSKRNLIENYLNYLPEGCPFDSEAICAVPMHKDQLLTRGFNQSELLSENLSKRWKLPLWRGLTKVKKTISQSSLTQKERQKNLKGSFQVIGSEVPRSVCLVDDIFTTGSTLHCASDELLRNGVVCVTSVTLFRTPYMLK